MLMVNEHVACDLELKRHYHIVLKALNLGFINKKMGKKHLHFKRISGVLETLRQEHNVRCIQQLKSCFLGLSRTKLC